MDCRIEEKDSFFIIGFSKRVRLQFEGESQLPHLEEGEA